MSSLAEFGRKGIAVFAAIAIAAAFGSSGCSSESAGTQASEASGEPTVAVDDPREEFRLSLIDGDLSVEQAGSEVEKAGYTWRIGEIDGEAQAVTMDYREDRLTFTVEGGMVTDASWG
jgi:hypothetical protein